MTSADSTHWTIPLNANASYNSNGMKFQGSGWTDAYLNVVLTKPSSIEFDLTQWSGHPSHLHYLWDNTKTTRHFQMTGSSGRTAFDVYPNDATYWNSNIPQGSHVKIEINNDNLKLYVDDDLKVTKSYNMPSEIILGLGKSGSTSCTWKNIKIKPL